MVTKIGTSKNDTLSGTNNDDYLAGKDGDDRLDGYGGNDKLWEGAGNGLIKPGKGDDEAGGGLGDDVILDEGGSDKLWGGDGNDYIHDETTNPEDENIIGLGNGDDFGQGSGRKTTMYGGKDDGSDFLHGGTAEEIEYYPGQGTDKVFLTDANKRGVVYAANDKTTDIIDITNVGADADIKVYADTSDMFWFNDQKADLNDSAAFTIDDSAANGFTITLVGTGGKVEVIGLEATDLGYTTPTTDTDVIDTGVAASSIWSGDVLF